MNENESREDRLVPQVKRPFPEDEDAQQEKDARGDQAGAHSDARDGAPEAPETQIEGDEVTENTSHVG